MRKITSRILTYEQHRARVKHYRRPERMEQKINRMLKEKRRYFLDYRYFPGHIVIYSKTTYDRLNNGKYFRDDLPF